MAMNNLMWPWLSELLIIRVPAGSDNLSCTVMFNFEMELITYFCGLKYCDFCDLRSPCHLHYWWFHKNAIYKMVILIIDVLCFKPTSCKTSVCSTEVVLCLVLEHGTMYLHWRWFWNSQTLDDSPFFGYQTQVPTKGALLYHCQFIGHTT